MRHKAVFFTSNRHKYEEVRVQLQEVLEVEQRHASFVEIQGRTFEDVVLYKLSQAINTLPDVSIIVEDSGTVIESLSSVLPFPGVYSKHVLDGIGLEGMLKVLEGKCREAKMVCVVGFYNHLAGEVRLFRGEVEGIISNEIRGDGGFGFDPIFIPKGYDKTFAEDVELKKSLSHRYHAFEKLKRYLLEKK